MNVVIYQNYRKNGKCPLEKKVGDHCARIFLTPTETIIIIMRTEIWEFLKLLLLSSSNVRIMNGSCTVYTKSLIAIKNFANHIYGTYTYMHTKNNAILSISNAYRAKYFSVIYFFSICNNFTYKNRTHFHSTWSAL